MNYMLIYSSLKILENKKMVSNFFAPTQKKGKHESREAHKSAHNHTDNQGNSIVRTQNFWEKKLSF